MKPDNLRAGLNRGNIAILGTMDTKGEEVAYLKECIEKSGHCTILIDVGPLGPPSAQPDITNTQVAQMAGYDLEELKKSGGRDQVMEKTGAGAARHLLSLIEEDRLAGVIGLGGNQGTAIASMTM